MNYGLRLRTACDLRVVSVRSDIELPVESELEKRLKKSIGKLARSGELAHPPVWKLKG